MGPALERTVGPPSIKEASFVCVERAHLGPLAFLAADRDLVILAGPTHVTGDAWKSSATCSDARRWGTGILAARVDR